MVTAVQDQEPFELVAESVVVPNSAASITEALALIDGELKTLSSREIVSAQDVSDLLLDLRLLLQPVPEPAGT